MISRSGSDFDVVLITAEYYDDHPLSPAGVIARVLDSKGYSVGIIEKPKSDEDFARLGRPRLFFGVTSGSIDSMLNNYTPLKKERAADEFSRASAMPNRAVIVYCNGIKKSFKDTPIVLGGIEASLRRFAHYDYWDNNLRRSIMYDSRADLLVYGNGEKQVLEIADRISRGEDTSKIPGTCEISKTLPEGYKLLPSFTEVVADKTAFCKMQTGFSNQHNLAQEYNNNYLLQHKSPVYTPDDLDWIYSLNFTRTLHPESHLKMARFSVVTHRGCIGACSFCSISLHQGGYIISRSEKSILEEIEKLTAHPDFRGKIDDLGGPSANMYGMDCEKRCGKSCLDCKSLDRSHKRLIALMKKARSIKGVKKIFVRSGIRYDLAVESEEYVRELTRHHVSGTLKIAPEHFSKKVLKLMNKDRPGLEEFQKMFNRFNPKSGQSLRYYLMIGHPGDDLREVEYLCQRIEGLENVEHFQLFTPTPMSVSSCMYWTGLNPYTLKPVKVVYDYHMKKQLKRRMLKAIEKSKQHHR
ncbi:MAG TPA: YgiQ family radical SAM protein [Euryarchaeota archaeon]|nr:YgiQ family radical SAM protein [Euryarchaeota archaeon]